MSERPDFVKIYEAIETVKREGTAILQLSGITIELTKVEDED